MAVIIGFYGNTPRLYYGLESRWISFQLSHGTTLKSMNKNSKQATEQCNVSRIICFFVVVKG